jgi:hypothetical protein
MAIPNLEALKLTTYAWFARNGATADHSVGTASRSLTSNVATLVTASDHGLWPGASVVVAGMTNTDFNGTFTVISVPTATSFTYAKTASNVASGADTGGTVSLNGTVSRTLKPMPGSAAWISLGDCRKSDIDPPRGQATEIWTPLLGQLVLEDVIRNKLDLKEMLECQNVSPLSLQLAYGTAALTNASTQANPMVLAGAIKGFLKTQHYDQDNNRRLTVDRFVELELEGKIELDPGNTDPVMAKFNARTLRSTLNTIGF